jgi:hypothetical protein
MRWIKEWRVAEAHRLVYGEPKNPVERPASNET